MITPTVGRVVWVRNRPMARYRKQPEVALITYVHSDTLVNIAGFDANGDPFKFTSIWLKQDPEAENPTHPYAEWMPYQRGQAAKYDALAATQGQSSV
jgi:hypothetical protein